MLKFLESLGLSSRQPMANGGRLAALDRAHAVIEFTTDGKILSANDNFLKLFGYAAHEVIGNHHRMFVDKESAQTAEYAGFWRVLGQGTFHRGVLNGFGRMEKKCGFRPPTTRWSTVPATWWA